MSNFTKWVLIGAAVTAAMGLGALYAMRRSTPIDDVLADPAAYQGRPVVVSGVVSSRAGLLGWKSYTLRGERHEIRVITNRVLPRIGEHVRVSGEVREVATFGDAQFVVLLENGT